MANLRVNKITGTEVFETTGSVQFDGGSSHLRLANTVDFDFATGNFTIEMWFYQTSNASRQDLTGNYVGASNGWGVGTNYDNTNDIIFYHGNTIIINTSTIYSLNTWNHLSVCRDSGTLRLFMNGNLITSVSDTTNISSTRDLRIGGVPTSLDTFQLPFQGHISNLRILKGTALYTSNFTPPTRELTVIPNTVLLCCQSTTRANEERTGKTITVNGNAVANELTPGLLTNRVKSGGDSAIAGSVEFDGTGDWLSIPSSSDFDFGSTNDFTIECWIYQQNRDPTYYTSLFQTDGSNLGGLGLVISPGLSGILQIYRGVFIVNSTSSVPTNGWVHIAATRNSGTTRLFINGNLDGSSAISYTPTFNDIRIGLNPSSGVEKFQGFISNLRVIKGTALYTQNFIPPTAELKNIPGTVLLCCQNSSSATQEATGKTITVNGNATARNFAPAVGFDGTVTFDGVTKINTENYFYLPTGNTEDRGRGRGILAGGNTGSATNKIDYISIQSSGISQDFGDLNNTVSGPGGGVSSQTRGLIGGGIGPGATNINNIDYITIAVTSNAIDFGDLLSTVRYNYGSSSNTRGLWGGGVSPALNTIQYVTIASTGNAISFGSLTVSRGETGSCGSNTRCVWGGGNPSTNTVDYVTITSTGNAVDFGDLSSAKLSITACSSSIRGVWAGGYSPMLNVIEYLTIASTGNAVDFGDLSAPRFGLTSVSNSIRGVFCGGQQPSFVNTMEYVNISSTGNVLDFGDLYLVTAVPVGCSDSHGGLG